MSANPEHERTGRRSVRTARVRRPMITGGELPIWPIVAAAILGGSFLITRFATEGGHVAQGSATNTSLPSDAGTAAVISERPGVPASLHDRYYGLSGVVGRVGTTATFLVPAGECVLTYGASFVLTTPCTMVDGALEPVRGPSGMAILVHDFETGDVVRTVDVPFYEVEAVMPDTRLVLIGKTRPFAEDGSIDAGIWMMDLADPSSSLQAVVESTNLSTTYGDGATRSWLRVTDRGHAVITAISTISATWTEVLDLQTLAVRKLDFSNESTIGVVDGRLAVTILPHDLGGIRPRGIRLVDIASGEVLAYVEADFAKGGIVIGDNEVFVQIAQHQVDAVILALDLQTGKVRELRRKDGMTETYDLAAWLSAPDVLGLIPVTGPDAGGDGHQSLRVTLLDTSTAEVADDAFTLP